MNVDLKLRDRIAEHIEKKMCSAQQTVYDHRDNACIETRQGVYLEIADAIIPMVKGEINRAKKLKALPKDESPSSSLPSPQ